MTDGTFQAGANSDDCYVYETGTSHPPWDWILAGSTNWLICAKPTTWYNGIGMRFVTVNIPNSATITAAYINFTAYDDENGAGVVRSTIQGEASDNAITFSTVANYNGRSRTSTPVNWNNLAGWTHDVVYASPSIIGIIQEIVNRAGWVSGNALVLFWEDNSSDSSSERTAWAYKGSAAKSPVLHVSWTVTAPTIPPVEETYVERFGLNIT